MKTTFTLLIAFFFAVFSVIAQTSITGGDVYGTWTVSGSPYIIEGDIAVPVDSLLEIEPGVSVAFQGAYIFNVNGWLNCEGTEADSIHFYSAITPGYRGVHIETDTNVMDSMLFTYCSFVGARCSGDWPYNCGGGISVWEYDLIRIEHCLFKDNRAWTGAQAAGGAIATAGFNGIIRNNIFIDNRSMYGGAMIIWENSNPIISYNHFENNRASYEGGAIITWSNSSGPIHHNTFVGNRANANGAAISIFNHSSNDVHHNLFYDNVAIKKGGAIFLELACNPVFLNNTFVDNVADLSGGAIHNEKGSCPRLINNILWGNKSPYGSQFCNDDTTCIPDFYHNDIQWGQGFIPGFHSLCEWKANIDKYPEFEDTLSNNFHLSWGSPCLDIGVDSVMDPDNTVSDLGAFWFDQTTAGVSDANQSDIEMTVYPNPAKSLITVRYRLPVAVDYQLSIFDVNGRLIDEILVKEKEFSYDVSHLTQGIYFINVNTGVESLNTKLIKK